MGEFGLCIARSASVRGGGHPRGEGGGREAGLWPQVNFFDNFSKINFTITKLFLDGALIKKIILYIGTVASRH